MIAKIFPRDIIAIITLIACFILIALGINHLVSGIAIMIITYYFSKRVYEEKNPNGNLKEKITNLEDVVKEIPEILQSHTQAIKNLPQNISAQTIGDFKPAPRPVQSPMKKGVTQTIDGFKSLEISS